MNDDHLKVPPIKIINESSFPKTTAHNNSNVDDDIFVSDWTEVKSSTTQTNIIPHIHRPSFKLKIKSQQIIHFSNLPPKIVLLN